MAIVAGDIATYYSGGSSNSDATKSLGGAKSSVEWPGTTKNDLFDDVSSAEAASGDTEYRGVYVQNDHASLTLLNAKVFVPTNTASADDTIAIALADEAIGAQMESVANEGTAPVGPTFSTPTDYAGGLLIGDLEDGEYRGVWVRRVVSASADPATNNTAVLEVQGDTAA